MVRYEVYRVSGGGANNRTVVRILFSLIEGRIVGYRTCVQSVLLHYARTKRGFEALLAHQPVAIDPARADGVAHGAGSAKPSLLTD